MSRRRVATTVLVIVLWSLAVVAVQVFTPMSLGNPFLCATDPTCGVDERVPPIVWLVGIGVILVVSYLTRERADQ